ncbi:hypothetical protein RB620_14985 [Paenibacillus sp. LHD-117]|nr:hypothetical protein [Paenibacillus sp. LHD-117]MDQ6420734.1 hypothetical protein [Paenibacillus sp. LHD-117]
MKKRDTHEALDGIGIEEGQGSFALSFFFGTPSMGVISRVKVPTNAYR